MSLPTHILSYEAEWMQIAYTLRDRGEFTLPCNNPKLANRYRFRFYGFRKALMKHDAANPVLGVLMETQVTVTPEGNLFFQRNHMATLLRGLLEHTTVVPHEATPGKAEGSTTAMEGTLLEVLAKHEKH